MTEPYIIEGRLVAPPERPGPTIADCTCPPCTTEDFRDADEICPDSSCPWGQDPTCPFHGS
jgi:hypothetical protein